jgi:uncharacterized protein (DUF983 family)
LAAGLAATVITWTFAAGFAPEKLDSLSQYSPWLYGPAATAAWALFSIIAYLFLARNRRPRAPLNSYAGYRCQELAVVAAGDGCSLCANQQEKNRLGGVTAGFALTISGWVAALSLMPDGWLDWLGNAPAWIYCIASVVVWFTLSEVMYLLFRALAAQNAARWTRDPGGAATSVRSSSSQNLKSG